jgi:hypothetical protein
MYCFADNRTDACNAPTNVRDGIGCPKDFNIWKGHCGGSYGSKFYGTENCTIICGKQPNGQPRPCTDVRGMSQGSVMDDILGNNAAVEAAWKGACGAQGPNLCPPMWTWKDRKHNTTATGSVCDYNNDANTLQGPRSSVRQGQLVPAVYSIKANHKGSISWIVTSAKCGDGAECFDENTKLGQKYNATTLEFDDDCTLPTFQKKHRMVEFTGQECKNYNTFKKSIGWLSNCTLKKNVG